MGLQHINIHRIKYTPYQTKGELVLSQHFHQDENKLYRDFSSPIVDINRERQFSCKTLELPWLDNQKYVSCIPTGFYRARKHISPTFGESIWILDVPGRSEILIHFGNYAGSKNPNTGRPDTKGCVLVGKAFVDIDGDGKLDVTASKSTMGQLYNLITNKNFYITVQ